MAKLGPGTQLGAWTLEATEDPKPGSQGALKTGPTQVWLAADCNGQAGVLKYCRDPATAPQPKSPSYSRKRFVQEVERMRQLTGAAGVLPVLDVDDSSHSEWFVTQKATLLSTHLGSTSELWPVVAATTELASTLADLNRHHGVTHRDIKPDNLFWLEGHAMVGDFGIAHHVDNAALTDAGNKAGPWGYIAPEALNNGGVDNWAPADVYSLAKSLWKFATGDPYPPQGTLLVFERHNCLHRVGGKAAFKLARLLEVCTAHNPHDRPSMRVLRDELQCWLNEHPADTVARPKPTKNASFYDPGHIMRKAARGGEDAIVDRCVRDILNPLRELFPGSSELTPASAGDLHPTAEIEHLVTQGDPDYMRDFDATLGLEWLHHPEARVIVQGIGTNDDAVYYGQWQTRPTAGGPWTPATPMRHTSGRLWFPTDHSARSMLSTQLADDKP